MEEQARLDSEWQRLTNNDPPTVLAALEAAFEDNQAPAAPINCEGAEVTLMMLYESPDLVPDRKLALTPSGKPTLHKRNKTERNELYAASLASNVLATAKEAFAVAPAISRVVTMVVRIRRAATTGASHSIVLVLWEIRPRPLPTTRLAPHRPVG